MFGAKSDSGWERTFLEDPNIFDYEESFDRSSDFEPVLDFSSQGNGIQQL